MSAGGTAPSGALVATSAKVERPMLTLSIDLDQRWGVRSRVGPRAHPVDESLLQVPDLVHRMLVALDRADIATTWFVPGALTCGSWDEYFAVAPDDPRRLPDSMRITTLHRDLDPTGRLHFSPAVIEELNARGRHEIGTCGFSALPSSLPGVESQDAVAEVSAACFQLERATGRSVQSVCFPNDDSRHMADVVASTGIRHVRTGRRPVPRPFARPSEPKRFDLWPDSSRRVAASDDNRTTVSPIDHSVRFVLSQMRWDVELRTLAHRCAHIGLGRNLHVRWSLKPGLGQHLDVDVASNRFVEVLGVILAGCERSGASIAPLDRLGDHLARRK